jgi:hypothetical protein
LICKGFYQGMGHNAEPVGKGRCCESCDRGAVTPLRAAVIYLGVRGALPDDSYFKAWFASRSIEAILAFDACG